MTIIESTPIVNYTLMIQEPELSMVAIIEAWAEAKYKRSHSDRTRATYKDTLHSFRAFALMMKCDLNSEARIITAIAGDWAAIVEKGLPSAATYSQRLAVLSSFYAFCIKRKYLALIANPLRDVERSPVQPYRAATYLLPEIVQAGLDRIDRTTRKGTRDYAVLCLGLETGRRATELASLTIGDLLIVGDTMTVQWTRTKGGKRAEDQVSPALATIMRKYAIMAYGDEWHTQPHRALWLSFKPGCSRPFGVDGIAKVCKTHFGTSKVHTLRHTTAKTMENQGATLTQIQHKLGHANIATTSLYLREITKADNPYASHLASVFGFSDQHEVEAP